MINGNKTAQNEIKRHKTTYIQTKSIDWRVIFH